MNYNTNIDGSHITAGNLDSKNWSNLGEVSDLSYTIRYWNDTPVRFSSQYGTFTNKDTVDVVKLALNSVYGATATTTTYVKTPCIRKVIFNPPATIVMWEDGTKTIVKCTEGEEVKEELGLAMAIAKRYFGNRSRFKKEVAKASRPQEKTEVAEASRPQGKTFVDEVEILTALESLIKKTFPVSKEAGNE